MNYKIAGVAMAGLFAYLYFEDDEDEIEYPVQNPESIGPILQHVSLIEEGDFIRRK